MPTYGSTSWRDWPKETICDGPYRVSGQLLVTPYIIHAYMLRDTALFKYCMSQIVRVLSPVLLVVRICLHCGQVCTLEYAKVCVRVNVIFQGLLLSLLASY